MASLTDMHLNTGRGRPARLVEDARSFARTWRHRRAVYRQTYAELASLSDRRLGDIGILRHDIPAVAARAARMA